jgi:transposase
MMRARCGAAPSSGPTGKYSKTELASMHGVSISTIERTLYRFGLDSISERHANAMTAEPTGARE